jgi:phosphorylcholine metabolism protein LicD
MDVLCAKYDVKYFLIEGSLRGAIIYKGFLPWDDDLDIGMTRDNYEKFVQFVVPELPNDIFFQNDETDTYYPSCHVVEAKLRDKYSSYKREKNTRKKSESFHDGLQIDISVFDQSYLPSNFFVYALNRALIFLFKNKGDKKRASLLKWISNHTPFPLAYGSSFISNLKKINQRTNYIKAKEIKNLIRAKFEDAEAYIPEGWESYLKRQYGNYMKLPSPESQKGSHGVNIPDPFTPCNHKEILNWEDRKFSNDLIKEYYQDLRRQEK